MKTGGEEGRGLEEYTVVVIVTTENKQ